MEKLSSDIFQILKQVWGYDTFRPLQEDIVRSVIAGKDTLALLPTGGGKSICFQVPALALDGVCVVVSPLISLMKDQVENLNKRGIVARAIYSGMNSQEIRFTLNQFLYGHAKFLYVSPERLQSEEFIEFFKSFKLGLLAIDEAHCISQWGYDFRPPYTQIAAIRKYHPNVPVLALTATATSQVVDDICDKLAFREKNIFQKSFRRDNLIYSVVNTEDKIKQMVEYFKLSKGTAVVYVRNRKKTESIAQILNKNGISADFYHAGLDNKVREKKQLDWINDKTRVMVATNAFGMGIDKPNVRMVIHLDIPESPEAYFQEAGRGGRDEKKANAILLNSAQDVLNLQKTLDETFPEEALVRHTYRSLANYFKLAHFTGEGRSFEIDLLPFFFTYNIVPKQGFNAIKILEKSELIAMIDADSEPPRIHINFQKNELYDYLVKHQEDEMLLQTLLRSYPGLFTNYVTIDEAIIASRMGKKEEEVVKQLSILHKRKVVTYIPRNKLPKVHFLQNMQNPETVKIYTPKINFLKKQATQRIKAMINYVTSTEKCRSRILLEYFGEFDSSDCGYCDICIQLNQLHISEPDYHAALQKLDASVEYTLDEIIKILNPKHKRLATEILRLAIDRGDVVNYQSLYYSKYINSSKLVFEK